MRQLTVNSWVRYHYSDYLSQPGTLEPRPAQMGFEIYYRSTRPVSAARAAKIRSMAYALNEARIWLSCEPVTFFDHNDDGRLFGGSKPNFMPHPDDVAIAAREELPDGTVRDLIDILCKLSKEFGVSWEFSHDYDPGPIGFIRDGVCEEQLLTHVEGIGDVGATLSDMMDELEPQSSDSRTSRSTPPRLRPDEPDNTDDGPAILPFRPRNS